MPQDIKPGKALRRLTPAELAACSGDRATELQLTRAHCPSNLRQYAPTLLAEEHGDTIGRTPNHDKKRIFNVLGVERPATEGNSAQGRPGQDIYDPFFAYPWSCIGKIFVGQFPNTTTILWEGCGVVVQPDLILTASHTIPWHLSNWWMRFVPSYSNGVEPYGSTNVLEAHGIPIGAEYTLASPLAYDMAICKLDQDIGERCGWMGTLGSTSDAFYTSDAPIDSFAGCGGYNMEDSTGGKSLQREIVRNGFVDAGVNDDGNFKLLDTYTTPRREGFTDAVVWTDYQGTDCVFGIKSGAFDSEGGGEDGYAGGPGIVQLCNWGIQNFGGS
ncbi:hypothetical protein MMC11_001363 [Xylographa trunciseda]|nr:hypothetical protein [Xylographa trunciseda]